MIRKHFFLLTFLYLQFTACNTINGANKKAEYYYYPARNVYYDVSNAQFIYSVNGGKTWEIFKKDITTDPATLGAKHVIYSETEPWQNNDADVKQYNGKIYSITDEDTTTQDIVSDKKIIKKITTAEPATKEKKPGFFKRLFGKKNK